MPNLRPVPISQNPASSWQNLVQRTVQSQNVIAGSGLRRTFGSGDFTQLSIASDVDFDHLVWRGNYTGSDEYFVNDVVRVVPNIKYFNEVGTEIPIGNTSDTIDQNDGDIVPISVGLFVCVQHVPPNWATPQFFASQVFPTFPEVVPYTWQDGIRWYEHNVYYPIYPEIPTQYTSSVNTGYGFTITANNTFWQAMPFGCIPVKVCENGSDKSFYVLGYQSGSKFDSSNLPYQG